MTKSKHNATCKPLFKHLNILPMPCEYILDTVMYIHKIACSFAKNEDVHMHNTRYKNKLHHNAIRLSSTKNTVNYQGMVLYNKLPDRILELPTKKFKREIKLLLLQHMFYDVEQFKNTMLL